MVTMKAKYNGTREDDNIAELGDDFFKSAKRIGDNCGNFVHGDSIFSCFFLGFYYELTYSPA